MHPISTSVVIWSLFAFSAVSLHVEIASGAAVGGDGTSPRDLKQCEFPPEELISKASFTESCWGRERDPQFSYICNTTKSLIDELCSGKSQEIVKAGNLSYAGEKGTKGMTVGKFCDELRAMKDFGTFISGENARGFYKNFLSRDSPRNCTSLCRDGTAEKINPMCSLLKASVSLLRKIRPPTEKPKTPDTDIGPITKTEPAKVVEEKNFEVEMKKGPAGANVDPQAPDEPKAKTGSEKSGTNDGQGPETDQTNPAAESPAAIGEIPLDSSEVDSPPAVESKNADSEVDVNPKLPTDGKELNGKVKKSEGLSPPPKVSEAPPASGKESEPKKKEVSDSQGGTADVEQLPSPKEEVLSSSSPKPNPKPVEPKLVEDGKAGEDRNAGVKETGDKIEKNVPLPGRPDNLGNKQGGLGFDEESAEIPFQAQDQDLDVGKSADYTDPSDDALNKEPAAKVPAQRVQKTKNRLSGISGSNSREVYYNDPVPEGSGYFNYFATLLGVLGLGFLLFLNKKRVIALVVEGRKPRGGRGRSRSVSSRNGASTSYRKLENNFE